MLQDLRLMDAGLLGLSGEKVAISNDGWWSLLGGPTGSKQGFGTQKIDSLNNIYVGGSNDPLGNGSDVAIFGKYSPTGVLSWYKQSTLPSGVLVNNARGIAIDASNTIWVGGNYGTLSTFDTSGNLLSSVRNTSAQTIFVSNNRSGNIFWTSDSSNLYNQLYGYLSGGSGSWSHSGGFQDSSTTSPASFDSSNNIFITCRRRASSSSPFYGNITKLNSAGTPLWGINASYASSAYVQIHGSVVDSSDNVYAIIYSTATGSLVQSVVKINSSGTVIYRKKLPGGLGYVPMMAIDSANNALYIISPLGGSTTSALLTKVSLDGTLSWVREFSVTGGGNLTLSEVSVDSNGSPCIVGATELLGAIIIKLPPKDAGLGSWGALNYTTNSNSAAGFPDYTTETIASGYSALGSAGSSFSSDPISTSTPSLISYVPTIIYSRPLTFYSPRTSTTMLSGQVQFTTPGTFSWTAPERVNSVSVLCIGGGGSGGAAYWAGGGGGGGGLGWKNNIAVIPGTSYTVVVGAGGVGISANSGGLGTSGGPSYFINTTTVQGLGGTAGTGTVSDSNGPYSGGVGGSYTGDGGGVGGTGGTSNSDTAGGGGGAAGYAGNGGAGGAGGPGSGGGGAGGINGGNNGSTGATQSGGGVGLLGQGTSGASAGQGGSGGANGSANATDGGSLNTGGQYGGGGGGQSNDAKGTPGCNGGGGAVRIMWGGARTYPTNAANV